MRKFIMTRCLERALNIKYVKSIYVDSSNELYSKVMAEMYDGDEKCLRHYGAKNHESKAQDYFDYLVKALNGEDE